jgi:hypothetical protein
VALVWVGATKSQWACVPASSLVAESLRPRLPSLAAEVTAFFEPKAAPHHEASHHSPISYQNATGRGYFADRLSLNPGRRIWTAIRALSRRPGQSARSSLCVAINEARRRRGLNCPALAGATGASASPPARLKSNMCRSGYLRRVVEDASAERRRVDPSLSADSTNGDKSTIEIRPAGARSKSNARRNTVNLCFGPSRTLCRSPEDDRSWPRAEWRLRAVETSKRTFAPQ